jgi:cytochrome c-type biogenesis protein CcmH
VRRLLLLVMALLLAATPALAVLPEEQLPDPVQEARARKLSKELRCVVCQNQTIDDSDAPLAADLRTILRERIKAGDSDDQAKAYLVDRYGDFVLLRPPVTTATLLLWFGPALALLLGGFGVWRYWRGRAAPAAAPAPLDPAERARLDALLSQGDR